MVSAGWATNGAGDNYSIMDERKSLGVIGNSRDVWNVDHISVKECLVRDLLSHSSHDMLIRHAIDEGAKLEDKCLFGLNAGIRCIVTKKYEYRSTSTKIFRRDNWRLKGGFINE